MARFLGLPSEGASVQGESVGLCLTAFVVGSGFRAQGDATGQNCW